MPRVLRIANRFNLGGPTYNVAYLTKYLATEFETMLIGGEKEDDEGSSTYILEEMGISPIIIPELKREIHWKNDRIAYQKIKKIIQDFRPDIVHTHASKAGAIGRLAAYNLGVPKIVHTYHGHVFHSYFGKLKTSFYVNVERWLNKRTDSIIAISEKQKQELVKTFRVADEEKVKVIPLGFDLEKFSEKKEEKRKKFREKYKVEEGEIVISIIGRLAPIKNHIFFIEVIGELIKNNGNGIRIFIIGDGETRTQIEDALRIKNIDFTDFNSNPIKATVTFTSWIKNVEVPLAGSDVICLTSLNEGTPVSLIEAQAAGKPVVSTNVGGVSDIISEGCGLISDVGDLNSMVRNLQYYLSDSKLRKQISISAPEKIKEKFQFNRLVEDVRALYRSLILD